MVVVENHVACGVSLQRGLTAYKEKNPCNSYSFYCTEESVSVLLPFIHLFTV